MKNNSEIYGGIALLVCALLAFAWANSPYFSSYESLWHVSLGFLSLHEWVNDGLMTLFFLYVGLEIKVEIQQGEMSTLKKALLPIAAAFGGMLLPAAIYAFLNRSSGGLHGWGIPMATDIAFATAVLSLLKRSVPSSLKVFLTALAIVDDMGAILVIAIFYAASISLIALGVGAAILLALGILRRAGFKSLWVYLLLGIFLWISFLRSGVHPTIAGVLFAFVLPSSLGHRLEVALKPWVNFAIMPIFALANAGVHFSSDGLLGPVSVGVMAGLIVGKQFGITLFSGLAVRMGWAELPSGISWRHVYGVACLGGIGFTVSLFIAQLAFTDEIFVNQAKIGILVASLFSAGLGFLILWPKRRPLDSAAMG